VFGTVASWIELDEIRIMINLVCSLFLEAKLYLRKITLKLEFYIIETPDYCLMSLQVFMENFVFGVFCGLYGVQNIVQVRTEYCVLVICCCCYCSTK
jgi:hypothetical protein